MNEMEWEAVVTQTAALMEQLQRNCESLTQQQAAIQSVRQMTQQAPHALRQSADELLKTLPDTLGMRVQSGLEKPVDSLEQRLNTAAQNTGQNVQQSNERLQALGNTTHKLLWKTSAIVIASLVLLASGGGWLLLQYSADIRSNQINADLLRTYNQADVVLCGGRLCANVDLRGTGAGDHGQYRIVLSRSTAEPPSP